MHIFTPLQPQPPGSHPLPLHRQMAAVSATYKLLYPVPGHGHHRGRVTLPVAVLIGTREIFIRTTIKYPILRRQQIFTGIGIILLNIGWCGTLLSLPHWNFCRPLLLLPLIRLQLNPSTSAKLNRWNIVTVLHEYILDMEHENIDIF